jgi:hypothetical protein
VQCSRQELTGTRTHSSWCLILFSPGRRLPPGDAQDQRVRGDAPRGNVRWREVNTKLPPCACVVPKQRNEKWRWQLKGAGPTRFDTHMREHAPTIHRREEVFACRPGEQRKRPRALPQSPEASRGSSSTVVANHQQHDGGRGECCHPHLSPRLSFPVSRELSHVANLWFRV